MNEKVSQVLFDIDGTLACIDHRRHFLDEEPRNWAAFFDGMLYDVPNQPVVNLYRVIRASKQYHCVIVTGRPELYREPTKRWLADNNISFDKLIMRKSDDRRPDYVVKQEMLGELLTQGASIEFVVDDRQSVVDMWRDHGLTCLQCADYDH